MGSLGIFYRLFLAVKSQTQIEEGTYNGTKSTFQAPYRGEPMERSRHDYRFQEFGGLLAPLVWRLDSYANFPQTSISFSTRF